MTYVLECLHYVINIRWLCALALGPRERKSSVVVTVIWKLQTWQSVPPTLTQNTPAVFVIAGCRHYVEEYLSLLEYYATSSDKKLLLEAA